MLGFGTVRFALPFELFRESENNKKVMVEMPGVEPGSNVYDEGQYDHVLLSSLSPSEKNRERVRVMTLESGVRHVSRNPTSLVTPFQSSEDQKGGVSAEVRT